MSRLDNIVVSISTPLIYTDFTKDYIRIAKGYIKDESKVYFVLIPMSDVKKFVEFANGNKRFNNDTDSVLIVCNSREVNRDTYLVVNLDHTLKQDFDKKLIKRLKHYEIERAITV